MPRRIHLRTLIGPALLLAIAIQMWLSKPPPDDIPGSFDPADVPAAIDPQVPLALDWAHSGKLFADVPELKNDPQVRRLLDTLTETTRRMDAYHTAYASCAVVGGSQNLLGKHYGRLIDSHDYVFRMNAAPIAGYEADAGTKTTHHIFSHEYGHYQQGEGGLDVPFYGPDTFNILYPTPTTKVLRIEPVYITKTYKDYEDFIRQLAAALDRADADGKNIDPDMRRMRQVPNLVVLSPEFWWYINNDWFRPKNKKLDDRASSGFAAIILARAMCQSVDVFGFGPDAQGNYGHYFSKDSNHLEHHRPSYQEDFLNYLNKTGVIRLYR